MASTRRILALWLPWFETDRVVRRRPALKNRPFVLTDAGSGRHLITAASPKARQEGLTPGMAVADARAILPEVICFPAQPTGDRKALSELALWARRFTPLTAPSEGQTLFLDITGCAHLWGGEEALATDLIDRLAHFGFAGLVGIADTPGAAWVLAHYGTTSRQRIVPLPSFSRAAARAEALGGLPVTALRLPAETVQRLTDFGLRHIADLYEIARRELAARFGEILVSRLDQLSGAEDEPIDALTPPPEFSAERNFPEPILALSSIEKTLEGLLGDLCDQLSKAGRGTRRLRFTGFGADGKVVDVEAGASRPARDPARWRRLFHEKLPAFTRDVGYDLLRLSALETEAVTDAQTDWQGAGSTMTALAPLIDSLGNRFGEAALARPEIRESWWPERAVRRRGVFDKPAGKTWPGSRPRPVHLFDPPLPVTVTAPVPDDPPMMMRWRGTLYHIRAADGPERLLPEWWHPETQNENAAPRDYYRVETEEGRRFWLYREGPYRRDMPPRWYLHGEFA